MISYVYTYIPPPTSHATLPDHHRTQSWASGTVQRVPTSYLFTHSGVYMHEHKFYLQWETQNLVRIVLLWYSLYWVVWNQTGNIFQVCLHKEIFQKHSSETKWKKKETDINYFLEGWKSMLKNSPGWKCMLTSPNESDLRAQGRNCKAFN